MFASIAPNIEVLAEATNMDTVVLSTTVSMFVVSANTSMLGAIDANMRITKNTLIELFFLDKHFGICLMGINAL